MEYKSAKDTWKKSGIYIIKNTLDDRVYIGSTNNFRERFRSHRNKLKIGKNASLYLQNFCNKYGIDKLNFEVLEIITFYEYLIFRYSVNGEHLYCQQANMHIYERSNPNLVLHPTPIGAIICATVTHIRKNKKVTSNSILTNYV